MLYHLVMHTDTQAECWLYLLSVLQFLAPFSAETLCVSYVLSLLSFLPSPSHRPWPWLHVKPDMAHLLFSHHTVTSSSHPATHTHDTPSCYLCLFVSLRLFLLSSLVYQRLLLLMSRQTGTRPWSAK